MARKTPASDRPAIPLDLIEPRIYVVREQKVMVDSHLAELYGETTARLNQQVGRNFDRFPQDFAFQLTREEFDALMLQFATSKAGRGGRRKLPWVFTEHGILMLSSVLRSERAVQVNIAIQCCPGKVGPTDGKSLPLNVLWPVLPGNDLKSRGRKWPPERSIPTRHNGG